MLNLQKHLLSTSIAVALLLGGALAAGAGLSALARPSDYDQRRHSLEDRLKVLKRAERGAASGRTYQKTTLCHGDLHEASDTLHRRLVAATAAAGSKLQDSFVAVGVPGKNTPDLTPLQFTLQATGSYQALGSTLGELARSQPEIFVERAEMSSQLTEMTLKIKGQVLCWTGA